MMKEFQGNSYLFGSNAPFIEALYDAYLKDPQSVEPRWRAPSAGSRNGARPSAIRIRSSTGRGSSSAVRRRAISCRWISGNRALEAFDTEDTEDTEEKQLRNAPYRFCDDYFWLPPCFPPCPPCPPC